ncbi:MAG: DUF2628 domain-containing protein [Xanthobacteraceae bacterium]
MSIYTVHEPPLKRAETAPDPERFVLVRDGFAFWAFLLAPLWMLRHRLWLVLLGYVLLVAALQLGLRALGFSSVVMGVVGMLVGLLIGLEAATLRRFTLARRGWHNVAIVSGEDLEAAERRFFDSWVSTPAAPAGAHPRAAPLTLSSAPRSSPDVIGLFPEPGGHR